MGVVASRAVDIARLNGSGSAFPGQLTAVYFVMGAFTAGLLGPHLDRLGARRTALAAGAVTAFGALPLLAAGRHDAVMYAGSALAGAAFSVTLPATNAVLGQHVSPGALVPAVCLKQAAVPLAMVLVAVSHPVTAVWSVGQVFLVAALVAVAVLVAFAWVTSKTVRRAAPDDPVERLRAPRYALAVLCASLLPGALIGYGALTLSGAGLGDARTAAVLATGNVAGVVTRILSAAGSARGSGASPGTWWAVAAMMWCGGVGAICMSTGFTPVAVGGALLAFSLGWGWSGLAFALVLVGSGERPAAAGAALQAGGMLGTAAGPVVMSVAVSWFGLGAGWLVIAGAMAIAGALVVPARGTELRRAVPRTAE